MLKRHYLAAQNTGYQQRQLNTTGTGFKRATSSKHLYKVKSKLLLIPH